MTGDPLFRETQRMGHPWLWALVGVVSVATVLFPAVVFDSFSLASGSVIALVTVLTLPPFLYSLQLITEVRTDGIYVRFVPVHRSFRRLPFDQVERVERTEFGLFTYGGIGIRWTPNTTAYIPTRGSGVKISRENAKTVVVGSQRPDALLEAIERSH